MFRPILFLACFFLLSSDITTSATRASLRTELSDIQASLQNRERIVLNLSNLVLETSPPVLEPVELPSIGLKTAEETQRETLTSKEDSVPTEPFNDIGRRLFIAFMGFTSIYFTFCQPLSTDPLHRHSRHLAYGRIGLAYLWYLVGVLMVQELKTRHTTVELTIQCWRMSGGKLKSGIVFAIDLILVRAVSASRAAHEWLEEGTRDWKENIVELDTYCFFWELLFKIIFVIYVAYILKALKKTSTLARDWALKQIREGRGASLLGKNWRHGLEQIHQAASQ